MTKSWSSFFDEISGSDGLSRFKAGVTMAMDDGFSIHDAILDLVSSLTFFEKRDAVIWPGSNNRD